ncbi:NAD(P)-dependent dehydrogenase, short-chain alcohol dehydrogenase family [Andreprevotia lacus DSM 23236]|jgi:NAD(P)-dependent dehydrogenase (short-subunit alcohol dehydrogenase family)|uniref:NAD(P)-dependent dehydrogenase, short-chain alcohol dehydrogenase family n=1 Tax=Andreprevotia lacus DSM 23236 TaxID=1121001 RepID=A0A1W1XPH8_9NEIS|nr:SDR family oxidoreductase [Andreprevotia lacus]SMC25774.1 NAD(P)-dependent dehydrogenase, short-chain alcohol dehydrogenase family [Andreprevotia lacus DSM 23236]
MSRFNGKTVLVTGGSSGIGLATAQAFAAQGAKVIITGRDSATLAKAQDVLGADALVLQSDAGSKAAAKQLASTLRERGITLDAVFLNAGTARFASLEGADESLWDLIFDVNVKGPFFTVQALRPLLNHGAAIVLNGSINAHIGMPNSSIYAASKAALISFAKTLSAELVGDGIRVNVVSPGPISTPLYGKLGVLAEQLSEVAASIQAQVPLKRFGTPEEVASAVTYLAAPESAFIVGTELIIDGGMSQL